MGLSGTNYNWYVKVTVLFIVLPFKLILAQDGPGGIGSKDGNSELELWLRADTGVTEIDGKVGMWADSSGNTTHAKAPTTNDSPSYSSNGLNGQPTIDFDKTEDEFLDLDNAVSTGSDGEVTIFIVFKPGKRINQNLNERTLLANDVSNGNSGFLALGDALGGSSDERITFGRNTNSGSEEGYFYKKDINNDFQIHQFTYDGNNANYFQDNSSVTLNDHNSGFSNASLEDLKRIGANANDAACFDGEIAEIIVYSKALEGAEKNIVANYLDAKYQLQELNASDYFTNSNKYQHDLIGLGFEDNNDDDKNHYVSSGGGGINLGYHHNNNLYNGDYFLSAHDDDHGIISYGQNNTNKRWSRTWKIQTNSLPSNQSKGFRITFRFDEYQIKADPSAGNKGDYVLLESDTEGFSNSDTVTTPEDSTILTEDSVSFFVTVGDINQSETFLSLGTTDPGISPLPVELKHFKTVKRQQSVELHWETASETNNHYFQVQRKTNGQWKNLGKVEGNGTTTEPQTYRYMDKSPEYGQNYYRLKQVDYDGSFEYTAIESVKWSEAPSRSKGSIKLKRNPVKTKLQVSFQNFREGTYAYQLLDVQGRVVQNGQWRVSSVEGVRNINMAAEENGIYILKVAGNNGQYSKKVLKN